MIYKYFGPPGTGKTHKLISRAKAYIRIGTPLDKIAYFAFTKKAADVAKNRMPVDNDKLYYHGDRCQNYDACFGIVCGEHGSCSRGRCICSDGYLGSRCRTAPANTGGSFDGCPPDPMACIACNGGSNKPEYCVPCCP